MATVGGRTDFATETAAASNLQKTEFRASPFVLTGWQKIIRAGEPIHIYIEGDGLAWLGHGRLSPNPTPKTPVALMLAAQDTGENVVYLTRPCQYTPINTAGNGACTNPAYWSNKRFAPEILNAYMKVLDQIAFQTGAKEFSVTGYSGGANIAGLLAARRTDITNLRTVAGNIDNDYFTRFHGVSAMPQSLNMASDTARLAQIPQIHFIGAEDKIVPKDIYQSYALKAGTSSCIHHRIVPNAGHNDGWENSWRTLQQIIPAC